VPSLIASCIATGKATLSELDTIYSIEDLHDMLEMAAVEAHNERVIRAAQKPNK
jgi:hypothetical protein